MSGPWMIDGFCSAGGTTRGYQLAGSGASRDAAEALGARWLGCDIYWHMNDGEHQTCGCPLQGLVFREGERERLRATALAASVEEGQPK